jgi:dienelactone hydrolase
VEPTRARRGLSRAGLVFTVMLFGGFTGCASAPPRTDLADGATGTIRFGTQTPTSGDFSSRNLNVPSAVIWGELTLPRTPSGRVPAVVLVHGSSGVGSNMPGWRGELTRMGVAAFIVDSFTGRGITETATDQSRLATSAMIVDAYRALALLATHPAIDRDRIAVMGFSKGGTVALYSSLTRFQRDRGPPGLRFAAHLPFYPSCSIQLLDEDKVAAPIRIFHGAADDWTPIGPCREYVERVARSGVDARILALANAHHGFDVPSLPGSLYLPRVQNGSRCGVREETPGVFVEAATGQPVSGRGPCVTLGATVGYHAQAHRAAIAGVKEFLTATFKLPAP